MMRELEEAHVSPAAVAARAQRVLELVRKLVRGRRPGADHGQGAIELSDAERLEVLFGNLEHVQAELEALQAAVALMARKGVWGQGLHGRYELERAGILGDER